MHTSYRPERFNRRKFLSGVTLAGTAGLLGLHSGPAAAEPPPETTRIRLIRIPSICQAPQYVAEELLRGEGFTDVQYIQKRGTADIAPALASGEVDLSAHFAAPLLLHLEAGDPIVILTGLHVGCFELFGTDRVQAIRDLKGKTVAVPALDSSRYVFLAAMTAYVGLDLHRDINFVEQPGAESIRLLREGKIDAYLGFPPEPQEMREQQIGHVVISSTVDRPWSQYFCCMLAGNREFVRTNPVATKRALRAILKAADFCASEPEQSAQFIVGRGYTKRYDHALQVMRAIPYGWREYSAEDTLRFYALRLHEVGMLKNTPQDLLAQGTDWRFLDELKKELRT
ncbi:ABC transporter substrate-binding protein [Mesorhizobium sp. CN2-181]|uniref:ABC transporter substrate-binding protein n=1 Tax=Mesorhizobium yinganensis TaxID=3157707 RepID=UPI0032B7727A